MKNSWKYLGITLVIGWFLGAASGLLWMHSFHSFGMREHDSNARREHFLKMLQLTPEQKTQVDAVIQESHQKLDAIFAKTKPDVDAVRQAMRTKIRQLLTPDQQSIFDKLDAKRQEHLKKHPNPWHD